MSLGLLWAKLRKNDAALRRGTLEQAALFERLKGQRVAIVGNARALSQTTSGADIDAHACVVRLNAAPMPEAHSHGTVTDFLAVSIVVPDEKIATLNPSVLLWMTPKRKRLPFQYIKRGLGFYLHPKSAQMGLMAELQARPTTGAMVISLIAQSPAASIDLYGFDFFSSLSLSGSRDAARVPHNFEAEARYVEALVQADHRITLHAME